MANKPEKQRYSGVACFIDGIEAKRVQTVTVTTDLTREQALELANAGTVEWIEGTPTVSITLDTNDVGSTDTLALLTDKMFKYVSGRNPELGPRNRTDFETSHKGIKHFIRAASSNASYRTITEQDMLNGYCSILVAVNQDGTSVGRTMWMNHCAVTGVAMSYDVNGNATENYTLTADNKTWYMNAWKSARLYKLENAQIKRQYTASSISFFNLASSIPTGSSVLAVAINGTIAKPVYPYAKTWNNWIWGASTVPHATTRLGIASAACSFTYFGGTLPLSTPYVSTASGSQDRVSVVFVPNTYYSGWEATGADGQRYLTETTANAGYELESTAGAIGAIRRGQVVAYLWNTQGPTGKITYSTMGKALRLQNVAIDISLGEEQLFELGRHGFYGVSKNTPVPVTVTVGFNDSDGQYYAMLCSSSESTAKDLSIENFNGYNALKLLIYKEKEQTNLLKTIDITKMEVQSENFNVSVGGNATHEITFNADNITIAGSGYNILGGWYGGL